MVILLTVLIFLVGFAISVLLFGASLFLVEGPKETSFLSDGHTKTWLKCAALVVAMSLLSLLPFGTVLGLFVFFAGVMAMFYLTFLRAFLLLVINGFVNWATLEAISRLLAMLAKE